MNITLWVVAGLLAAGFLFSGAFKVAQGKKVEEKGMRWASLYSDKGIRAIGAVEIVGALGLILPAVTGIATWLVPVAAAGLAVTMVIAAIAHARVKDPAGAFVPVAVLGALAVFVAVGRAFIEPFGG